MKIIFIFLLIFCGGTAALHSYMDCSSARPDNTTQGDCYLTIGLDNAQTIQISDFRISCKEERKLLLQLRTGLDDLPQVLHMNN